VSYTVVGTVRLTGVANAGLGVYTLFPVLFTHSLLQTTVHSLLTSLLAVNTLWNYSLAVLHPAGKPPHVAPWLQPRPSHSYGDRPPQGAYYNYMLCTPCQSAVRIANRRGPGAAALRGARGGGWGVVGASAAKRC
jgi:hypothetical protein